MVVAQLGKDQGSNPLNVDITFMLLVQKTKKCPLFDGQYLIKEYRMNVQTNNLSIVFQQVVVSAATILSINFS